MRRMANRRGPPPVSPESERLAALRALEILDTAPEEAFNDLVRLAAWTCGTSMAAVSLVDADRQWFKARLGLGISETPRSDAFCAHTIGQRDVLEVGDATTDPRFADNPLVTGLLGLRFYAAAPLVTLEDFAIGTLCVLDTKPRTLDSDQRMALRALANQTMGQIVLRQQVMTMQRLEARFRAVVEESSDMIVFVDKDGVLRYVSPAVYPILGYQPADLVGRDIRELILSPDALATVRDALQTTAGERTPPAEIRLRRADGTMAHLEFRCSNMINDAAVQALVFHCRDISELRDAEWALERTLHDAVQVLETAHDAYIQLDTDGRVTDWNRQATVTFGWERNEAIGHMISDLIIPDRHRETHRRAFAAAATRTLETGEMIVSDLAVSALRRDGSELPVEVTVWSTQTPAGTLRFSSFVRDVTERQALEERLAHMAIHDDLTGLPNRYLLADRLSSALARAARGHVKVGVLFCDLDRFKVVNDSRGHSVGDEVLREAASRLKETVRSIDTVVRFGGDEFVVVLDGVEDEMDASRLAERIRMALAEPVVVEDLVIPTSVSVGVVVSDGSGDAEQIISDADAAMYLAKEQGRDRIEVFDRALRTRVQARLDDERAIRLALDRNEFRLSYQPIVALADRAIIGAEALVRWERPDRGLVGPGTFVPLAEETGLIVPLGEWVLVEACEQLRRWQEATGDRHLSMSVNVAARQVTAGELGAVVDRVLDCTGIDPRTLTLEVTESTLMENLDQSKRILSELTRAGVRIAIDDFGTGYSSLSYLKSLPIATLKVDRSFIVNLAGDPYDSAIVRAVATIAHALNLRVVSEGVETADQAYEALEHGSDWAQGYYFARPMAAEELLIWSVPASGST